MRKKRLVILFGGKSAEHEVSIVSAKNVYQAPDKEIYEVVLVYISKKGVWFAVASEVLDALPGSIEELRDNQEWIQRLIIKEIRMGEIVHLKPDVIFPVLHGPYGEEGSVQGFLKLLDIPFVGSGILGSAIGMDKDVQKRLLRDAGLPITEFVSITRKGSRFWTSQNDEKLHFISIEEEFSLPFFVKPANMGSSIGVMKVKSEKDFNQAIEKAFSYDTKVLIEKYVPGIEVECSVLGNDDPIVSIPGEIIAQHEFYDYSAKYLDENGAILKIPAELSEEKIKEVQNLALKTFEVLCLEGMARVDFFYSPEGKFFINEVNTIPGFTNISMYPKLWEASGISQTELINRLIKLAIEKHEKNSILRVARGS